MRLCQVEDYVRCGHCHRVFEDIRECDRHVLSRGHGTYCRVEVVKHCHHDDDDHRSIVIRDNPNAEPRRRKMWSTFEYIGGREKMEDFLLVDEAMGVVAVFDGYVSFFIHSSVCFQSCLLYTNITTIISYADTKALLLREQFETRFEIF